MEWPFYEKPEPLILGQEVQDSIIDSSIPSHIPEKRHEFNFEMLKGIQTEAILETSPMLFQLAKEIIGSGKYYDLVLGDDTGGRLAGLFVKKIVDGVNEQKGQPNAEVRFVAAAESKAYSPISVLIRDMHPKNTLIATEYIQSGVKIKTLGSILLQLGLKFDVATVSLMSEKTIEKINHDLSFYDENYKTEVYFGEIGDTGLRSLDKPWYSGVQKGKSTYNTGIPVKYTLDEREKNSQMGNSINKVREDIELFAQRTLEALI